MVIWEANSGSAYAGLMDIEEVSFNFAARLRPAFFSQPVAHLVMQSIEYLESQ